MDRDTTRTALDLSSRSESICRCLREDAPAKGSGSSIRVVRPDAGRLGSHCDKLIKERTRPWSTSFIR
jgi:hypothetical protein